MKKILLLIIAAAMLLGLSGCQSRGYDSGGDGLNIVATVFPAYDFAREIAGDRASVHLLIPPGSEIHSFEPTAQDILRIQNCDLLVCNGGESEVWLEEVLAGLYGDVPTLVMLDCVDALEEEIKEGMQSREEHSHEAEAESGESEPEYDEHVWTSPVNAQLICRELCRMLCQADEANSSYYKSNAENYVNQLEDLDAAFRRVVDGASCKTLIFADRFPVRYFVEEYGLDYYAAFPGCADDAEPSAKTVAFLIDRVREEQTPAVLYIEFSNQKMADIVAEDTGCKELLFHSCHNITADDLEQGISYMTLMERNVETVREALG